MNDNTSPQPEPQSTLPRRAFPSPSPLWIIALVFLSVSALLGGYSTYVSLGLTGIVTIFCWTVLGFVIGTVLQDSNFQQLYSAFLSVQGSFIKMRDVNDELLAMIQVYQGMLQQPGVNPNDDKVVH